MDRSPGGHAHPSATTYEIRIDGFLDSRWKDWFDGMNMTYLESGETVLIGELLDQAALYGVLTQIRDLGVTLISVSRIPSSSEQHANP